ncbi:MAG: ABC transporter, partial [Bifidobacterium bifidum]|nr:ABC transporter [Bifidobacterium bifidum]
PSTGPPCRSPGPPPSWSASSPASTRPPAPPVSPRPRPCAANRGDGWSERSP